MIFFKNSFLLPLVWFTAALIPLLGAEYYLRRRQHGAFTGSVNREKLHIDQIKRSLFLFGAALFLFAALLRPSWNPSVRLAQQEGRDVVFLLDVSRSMTAGDVAPSRLERAKLEISETLQIVDGDRVALVAFAGNSVVKCPLTLDYGFFSLALEAVSVNSVSKGGSQLGDALRMVESQVFDSQAREQRDIILITDGEDQDSFPVEAAEALGAQGIRLIIIGLGDTLQGARILDSEGNYLTYKGEEVWSKMDGDILRKMAAATPGGRYLEAGQADFSLPQIYKSLIGNGADKKTGEEETLVYEEKFQLFIALALVFLFLEALRIIGPIEGRIFLDLLNRGRGKAGLFILFLFFMGLDPGGLGAEGRADLYRQGENALEEGNWNLFARAYDKLSEKGADSGKIAYNRGRSLFKQENYSGAAASFGEAASLLEGKEAARALYNRGNALLEQSSAGGEGESGQSGDLTKQAAEAYSKALMLDPGLKEASRNLEILKSQEQPPQDSSGEEDSSSNNDNQDSSQSGDEQADNNQDQGQDKNSEQNPEQNPEQGDASPAPEEDDLARSILEEEEADREERESTLQQGGGVYAVERDW